MLCVFTWVTDAHDKLEINLNYTFRWSKRPPTYPQIVVKSFIYSLTNQSHDSGVNLQEVIKINGSLLVCVAACNCSQTTGTHFDSLREREKKLRKRKPTAYCLHVLMNTTSPHVGGGRLPATDHLSDLRSVRVSHVSSKRPRGMQLTQTVYV